MKKNLSGLMALLFILAFAMPAQAFYVELPKNFARNWQSLIASEVQKVLGVKVLGEEEVNPAVPMAGQPLPENQNNLLPLNNLLPPPGTDNQPSPTCRVNGVDMPGSCDQYNNNSGGTGNLMPQNQPGQNFNPNPNQPNGGDQNQQKNQERMTQDIKRNIKQMESSLKRLESTFKSAAKGIVIPAEVSDKLKEARNMMEIMKAAQTPEAMQEIDMGGLNETMQSLDQSRQDIVEGAQRVDGIKRGVKGMESGLKMFANQIAKLAKQKIVVPTEVMDNLNKVKAIIAAIKTAKTMDEMNAAGAEDLQEAMQNLDESRGQLEMLARWPQTLKQMNSELSRLNAELKKAKAIVERLKKQEIDLSDTYAQFEAAVAKMKAVKDQADNDVKAGGSTEVFDNIQADFFGQMEDTMQYQRVIMTMSNLSRFNADFKKGIAQAQSQIRKLKAKKFDSSMAEGILNDINNKGKEILAMLKAKPINEDDIILTLEDMETLNQDFNAEVSALTDEAAVMPWEQGPQQFQQPQMPNNWQQLMPQQNQPQSCPPCNCSSQNY